MSVLTICNHKGGTGKTTTSIHLAAALALQGRRVLVVDFDPQGFLTRMLGASEPRPEHSSLGLLDARADLRAFPVQQAGGFDLVGSSMSLTKALRTLTKPTDVLWLRETVRAGHDYDLVLLDTPAALSVYTMNALVASDHVVVPVTPEYQPVVGAEQTWQTVGLVRDKLNPALAEPRFLLTQVDARLNRHARYAEYLRDKYGPGVLQTAIRTSSSLAAASRDGQTVYDVQPTARGALDYAEAAQEIAGYAFGAGGAAPDPATGGAAPPAGDAPDPATSDAAPPATGGVAARATDAPAPPSAGREAAPAGPTGERPEAPRPALPETGGDGHAAPPQAAPPERASPERAPAASDDAEAARPPAPAASGWTRLDRL